MRNLNLPNLLSFSRLLLTPFAVRTIMAGEHVQALAVLALAGVTDGLDGLLARRLHLATRLGAYLDPIADKVLISATYLALGFAKLVPWWLVGLIFGRDVLILAMVALALAFTSYREFPPSAWGKISTTLQVVAGVFVIFTRAFPRLGLPADPLLWAAAAATAISGAGYVVRAVRMAGAAARSARA